MSQDDNTKQKLADLYFSASEEGHKRKDELVHQMQKQINELENKNCLLN